MPIVSRFLLATSIVLFSLSTAYVSVCLRQLLEAFIWGPPGGASIYFATIQNSLSITKLALYEVNVCGLCLVPVWEMLMLVFFRFLDKMRFWKVYIQYTCTKLNLMIFTDLAHVGCVWQPMDSCCSSCKYNPDVDVDLSSCVLLDFNGACPYRWEYRTHIYSYTNIYGIKHLEYSLSVVVPFLTFQSLISLFTAGPLLIGPWILLWTLVWPYALHIDCGVRAVHLRT